MCSLPEIRDTLVESKRMEKDILSNSKHKKADSAILIWDRNFRTKNITEDKDVVKSFTTIKGEIHQDGIIIPKYICNKRASKYIKCDQKLKREIAKSTIIVGIIDKMSR